MANNIRIEEDLLGMREVPADAYNGVHTLRAIENFISATAKSATYLNLSAEW